MVINTTNNNNIPLNITGGTPTSVAVASGPSHGTTAVSGLTIKYTPTASYSGSDSFTYTATNGGGTSAPATASITVLAIIADGTVMYTSSTPYGYSFTLPINAPPYVTVFLYGAGGGGWGSPSNHHGGGGGGYTTYHFAVTPGVTVLSGNIGLQGDGGFHIISDPTAGSATTMTSPSLMANGGNAGSSTAGGAGGTASGGSTNTTGQAGDVAGAAYGGANLGTGGGAASSPGNVGNPPGGGGSASTSGSPPLYGQNGANGEVIIVAHTH